MSEQGLYLATCQHCGGEVAVMVDNPERRREVAKDVAQWIRLGLAVTRIGPNDSWTLDGHREGCTMPGAKVRAKKRAVQQEAF